MFFLSRVDMELNAKHIRKGILPAEEKALYSNSDDNAKENGVETNTNHIYFRITGYIIGGAVHLGNVLAMALALRGPIMKDPDIEFFYSMEFFYLTIWNLAFQLLYIGMGLSCDGAVLFKQKYDFLDKLRRYRKVFYNGILWPCGVVIFIMFWPTFTYDRNLVFPDYIDKVLSPVSNYIIHMFIMFPILWDLVFLPNQKPASQKYTLSHCLVLTAAYFIAMFALYAHRGIWPYPVIKMIYGTFYFPLVIIIVVLLTLVIYFIQWPIISYIWGRRYSNICR
ncbi:androgen-induced gene 1 protein-like [Epargyreus clarus]|uniref:androgen-induced gene 1 protein-like n=1 Tax=Epargyreus clarus TaxID=520877 RepID=UPI003C30BAF8